MSPVPYRLYGWELSLYSGKVRAYLRHKGIAFREKRINLWEMREIKRRTGAQVMPVVVTPEGEWLQDTSHIIDVLEARFPQSPVVPVTPKQHVAAYLLEAWGDEFWLPSAMHYRWNFPENFHEIFQTEGGDNLLPFAPRFLKNKLIAKAAGAMRSFLPGLGVNPQQAAIIEAWTQARCDALDTHFARYPYLLGARPCLGDYGLIGPLYAHLGRDPYPVRALMASRPHLAAWVQRMLHPPASTSVSADGEFLPDDEVPDTLRPVFDSIFGEFWPYLLATRDAVERATPSLQPGRGYRRALDIVEIPQLGRPFKIAARPYSLWMAQRVLDAYAALPPPARVPVDAWLADWGGGAAMTIRMPRLKRLTLHVAPA